MVAHNSSLASMATTTSGLLQSSACAVNDDACAYEKIRVLLVLGFLTSALTSVLCAFAFFRDDKEEHINPLCPQLVVKESDVWFQLPLDDPSVDNMEVADLQDRCLCKIAMDWPDPFRPGASGVAATVRLQNNLNFTLATVVARNVAVIGQGLALCRSGCEIFGFVEPDGPCKYVVRHRMGLHLMTLVGDFAAPDIEGISPAGAKVFWVQQQGKRCQGKVLQHVDMGLVICAVLATRVHRRLTRAEPLPAPAPRLEAVEEESSNPANPIAAQPPTVAEDEAALDKNAAEGTKVVGAADAESPWPTFRG